MYSWVGLAIVVNVAQASATPKRGGEEKEIKKAVLPPSLLAPFLSPNFCCSFLNVCMGQHLFSRICCVENGRTQSPLTVKEEIAPTGLVLLFQFI